MIFAFVERVNVVDALPIFKIVNSCPVNADCKVVNVTAFVELTSTKLDINPIWWDQSNNAAAGTTGEVTFVYSKQDK